MPSAFLGSHNEVRFVFPEAALCGPNSGAETSLARRQALNAFVFFACQLSQISDQSEVEVQEGA